MGLNDRISKLLVLVLYIVIALVILYLAPGVVNAIFEVGRKLGVAIGNVIWR